MLRGHLSDKHVSGVKVVGDFVGNVERGLPSEMALILLLDPETGTPKAISLAAEYARSTLPTTTG